jgi:hypothetical protein
MTRRGALVLGVAGAATATAVSVPEALGAEVLGAGLDARVIPRPNS